MDIIVVCNGGGSVKVIEVELVHELLSVISKLYIPAERFVMSWVKSLVFQK